MISLNLNVPVPTNSKALKHLRMCLFLAYQSFSFIVCFKVFVLNICFCQNYRAIILEKNVILLFAITEGEAVKEPSVETEFMLPDPR